MFEKIGKNKIFEELLCLSLALITILSWKFSSISGMIILIVISTIIMLVYNDLAYAIPGVVDFIFVNNTSGFSVSKFPIMLAIFTGIFVLLVIFQMFRSGFSFKNGKSKTGIILITILFIVPIFWNKIITIEEQMLYMMYFAWIFYFLIYIIFSNGIKKPSLKILSLSMTYMGIILAFQCGIRIYEIRNSIFSLDDIWYYLGWGLCNEAGIMMCVSLPFVFYLFMMSKTTKEKVLNIIKLGIIVIGMILTNCRGTYLFGSIELFLLILYSIRYSKKKTLGLTIYSVLTIILIILGLFFLREKFGSFLNHLFIGDFDIDQFSSNRITIYIKALANWKSSNITVLFGSGIVSEYATMVMHEGYQKVVLVFHSTFFETLVCSGVLGVIALVIHLIQKYKNIFKYKKMFAMFMFIGYICVDLYGLIDNTYHMYYYTIVLMIIMAVMDNDINLLNDNDLI